MEKLSNEKPYFTLSEAFQLIAEEGKVSATFTDNLTWFAIETTASLRYALEKHEKSDNSSWFRKQVKFIV